MNVTASADGGSRIGTNGVQQGYWAKDEDGNADETRVIYGEAQKMTAQKHDDGLEVMPAFDCESRSQTAALMLALKRFEETADAEISVTQEFA